MGRYISNMNEIKKHLLVSYEKKDSF